MKHWGIDLGGTKTECAVLDENKNLLIRKRIATEAGKGYQHILQQIRSLIENVSVELGETPSRVGFGTPGVSEADTQTMKNCNTVCLNGKPMKIDLENILGLPVKIANDANCFALSEAVLGAGRDYPDAKVVFGVIMGTGVGGGLIVNGSIIEGKHGLGGEWGHNILEEGGVACYCGKQGCVETVISGPGIEKHYQKISGKPAGLREIVQWHLDGTDPHAVESIERLLEYYGRAISVVINIVDPDLVIIGGGVGNIDLLYTEDYERIRKYVFNNGKFTTPVCKPLLGDSAGVFGAALLWEK